jgi:hypothetical protein
MLRGTIASAFLQSFVLCVLVSWSQLVQLVQLVQARARVQLQGPAPVAVRPLDEVARAGRPRLANGDVVAKHSGSK